MGKGPGPVAQPAEGGQWRGNGAQLGGCGARTRRNAARCRGYGGGGAATRLSLTSSSNRFLRCVRRGRSSLYRGRAVRKALACLCVCGVFRVCLRLRLRLLWCAGLCQLAQSVRTARHGVHRNATGEYGATLDRSCEPLCGCWGKELVHMTAEERRTCHKTSSSSSSSDGWKRKAAHP